VWSPVTVTYLGGGRLPARPRCLFLWYSPLRPPPPHPPPPRPPLYPNSRLNRGEKTPNLLLCENAPHAQISRASPGRGVEPGGIPLGGACYLGQGPIWHILKHLHAGCPVRADSRKATAGEGSLYPLCLMRSAPPAPLTETGTSVLSLPGRPPPPGRLEKSELAAKSRKKEYSVSLPLCLAGFWLIKGGVGGGGGGGGGGKDEATTRPAPARRPSAASPSHEPPTTEIYTTPHTLPLPDALPIWLLHQAQTEVPGGLLGGPRGGARPRRARNAVPVSVSGAGGALRIRHKG
jgi:hypothetical protein